MNLAIFPEEKSGRADLGKRGSDQQTHLARIGKVLTNDLEIGFVQIESWPRVAAVVPDYGQACRVRLPVFDPLFQAPAVSIRK